MNNSYYIILSIIIIIYLIKNIKDNKLDLVESIFWLSSSFVILFLSVFPKSIDYFALFIGVNYPPSLLFVICILFLVFMNFRMSKKIAKQEEKIVSLAQEVSILKQRKNIENRKDN